MGGVLVAQSNRGLLAEQEWLERTGYVAVPGTGLRSEMGALKTYLAGGLFFGLSIGICYAFIWGLAVWVFYPCQEILLLTSFNLLFLIFYLYFSHPWSLDFWPLILFLFIIPFLLYFICFMFRCHKGRNRGYRDMIPYVAGFIGCMLIVYIIISPALTGSDFIRIRDGLFGRTYWGRRVNDFYYHYTLYPARVIKGFNQRLQRVMRIENEGFTKGEFMRLKKAFAWRDIFIGSDSPSRTVIMRSPDSDAVILLCESPGFRLDVKLEELIADPTGILDEYSLRTDTAAFFREIIGLSLFRIWPVMGIFMIYCLFVFLCAIFFRRSSPARDAFVGFLLILILVAGLRLLLMPRRQPLANEALLAMVLPGESKADKIRAIMAVWERIEQEKLKPNQYSGYFLSMLDDPDPLIRRWGIYFITRAGEKKGIKPLLALLNDPDPGVAYHAARSLGKLRAGEARDSLLNLITSDREWYLKTTAYISLRQIGWGQ